MVTQSYSLHILAANTIVYKHLPKSQSICGKTTGAFTVSDLQSHKIVANLLRGDLTGKIFFSLGEIVVFSVFPNTMA